MSVAAIDHTGPWTVADVLALPEDRSHRYELLGESLIVSPPPAYVTSGSATGCT